MAATNSAVTTEQALQGIQQQLAVMNERLELIAEQAEGMRRRWETIDDLAADLTLVGQGAMEVAVEGFSDLDPYVRSEDLLRLFRRLLENTQNLEWALQQLESVRDFTRDAGPIANIAVERITQQMDDLDRKGILSFFQEAYRIVDIVLTNYTPEDVRALADNVVLILDTVKGMTQPEMMRLLNNLTSAYQQAETQAEELPTGTFALLKAMRDPQMRRGLATTMEMLRIVSTNQQAGSKAIAEDFSNTDNIARE